MLLTIKYLNNSSYSLKSLIIATSYFIMWRSKDCYSVCHGFEYTNRDDYFRVIFDRFWSDHPFLRHLGKLQKLAWALNLTTKSKIKQVKLVQILVMQYDLLVIFQQGISKCFTLTYSGCIFCIPLKPHFQHYL